MADDAVRIDILIEDLNAQKSLQNVENASRRTFRTFEQESKRGERAARGFSSALGGMRRAWGLVASVAGGFGAAMLLRRSTEAFIEQASAVGRVTGALRLQGITSKAVLRDLEDWARGMQEVTTNTDQAYLSAVNLALGMNATVEQAKELAIAAGDLSIALGQDMPMSIRQLARTLGGLAGELGERLPAVSAMSVAERRSGAAIRYVRERFGGLSQSLAETTAGEYQQALNQFTEQLEHLGERVLPAFTFAVEGITGIFSALGIERERKPPTSAEVARGRVQIAAQESLAGVNSVNERLKGLGLSSLPVPGIAAELDRIKRLEDRLFVEDARLERFEEIAADLKRRGYLGGYGSDNERDPVTGLVGSEVRAEMDRIVQRIDQLTENIQTAGTLSAKRIRDYQAPGLNQFNELLDRIGESGPQFEAAKSFFESVQAFSAEETYNLRMRGIMDAAEVYSRLRGAQAGGGFTATGKMQREQQRLETLAGMEFMAAESPALTGFHEEFKLGIAESFESGVYTAIRGGGIRNAFQLMSQSLADSVAQAITRAISERALGGLLSPGGGLDKAFLSLFGVGGEAGAAASGGAK